MMVFHIIISNDVIVTIITTLAIYSTLNDQPDVPKNVPIREPNNFSITLYTYDIYSSFSR